MVLKLFLPVSMHAGCPFRHWDRAHLSLMLQRHGVSSKDSKSVLEYVDKSHYQLACQRYFEITHKVGPGGGWSLGIGGVFTSY